MAAVRDDQLIITAIMKNPGTTQSSIDNALQSAQAKNGAVALLKRTPIRDYNGLMKKLLTDQFIRTMKWNSLMDSIVLCTGFHTPKRESAIMKLTNLVYVLEYGSWTYSPAVLLREIVDLDPNLINEFSTPILSKQYPNPFSKADTLLQFTTLQEKEISSSKPLAGEIEPPPVPLMSTVGTFFKALTASSAPARIQETSDAQKIIIEKNKKIQAELEEAEAQRETMEKEIQQKVQEDIRQHLITANLTPVDLTALASLYDKRIGLTDPEIAARNQQHTKALALGERTGSQLAQFVFNPELLFDQPQTQAKLRLALEVLLRCIKEELRRGPVPRNDSVARLPECHDDDDDNAAVSTNNAML